MKKKGLSWFKSANSNQNQSDKNNIDPQTSKNKISEEGELSNSMEIEQKDKQKDKQNDNPFFIKNNQDKVVLDLIVALENIVKERELLLHKNKELKDQLHTATETISRIKHELTKKDQLLQESSKEISKLENKLSNKQMSYDQLLEDYREYQNTASIEYERISNQLETEINKYNKLNEEFINFQHQNLLKINELEETIRILKIEKEQLAQQYQQILDEKSQLMQTINDFTARMSFSFSQKQASHDSK